MNKVLVVDGPNLLMRSVYAMRAGNSFKDQGAFTGPLVLFLKVLGYQIRQIEPDHILVCWEGGKSRFRTESFDGYKANRSKDVHPLRDISFDLVNQFLELNYICQASAEGFEADDVIASYVRPLSVYIRGISSDLEVYILSADKDLLQLVDTNVTQIKLGSGGNPTEHWGPDEVVDKFGCSPEQLPALMAVMGDKSDGIPGVPGMGPKKALKALREHGWDLTTNDHPAIVKHRDEALLSLRLVDLRNPEDAPDVYASGLDTRFDPPTDDEAVENFLLEYNLKDLLNLFRSGTLWRKEGQMNTSVEEIRSRFKNHLRNRPESYNPNKNSVKVTPKTINILSSDGKGLSPDVERMLRERLLKGDPEATKTIYEAVGMTQDMNGVWGHHIKAMEKNRPSETPAETQAEVTAIDDLSEAPTGDTDRFKAIKRQMLRSRGFSA